MAVGQIQRIAVCGAGLMGRGIAPDLAGRDRFASMYGTGDVVETDMTFSRWFSGVETAGDHLIASPDNSPECTAHHVFRGGHGLVSTAADYLRFCQMLLDGGALDGGRILGRKTVELMTANHLRAALLPSEIAGMPAPENGFGLGMRVLLDVAASQAPGSVGEYGWSGAADTYFWIDPAEELVGIQLAQFQPSMHLIGADFRAMAYQAIVD